MRQLALVVVMTCSTLALAQPKDGGVCSPKARFHLFFDRVELIKLSQTISDVTCKPVVLGPGVEKVQITVVTPEDQFYTAAEFSKIVTAAADSAGATIVENQGVIRITLKK